MSSHTFDFNKRKSPPLVSFFVCKTWRETQNSYSGLNKPQRNDDSRRQKLTAKILLGAFFVGKHWLVGFEFQEIEIEIETRGTFANTIVFYVCSQ